MGNLIFKRLLAVLLASMMLISALPVISFASNAATAETAATDEASGKTTYGYDRTVEDILALISADPYSDYLEKYSKKSVGTQEIIIEAKDYNVEETTASPVFTLDYDGVKDALYTPSEGSVSWNVTIPDDGLYAMELTYYPVPNDFTYDGVEGELNGMRTTMERIVYIDGVLPFSEARYLYFPRLFEYQYSDETEEFDKDINGNDIRPVRNEVPDWYSYYLRDWLGFTMEPFQFYFSAGEHTITIEASREPMLLKQIRIYPYNGEVTYEEYYQSKIASGAKEITTLEEPIKIEAENPILVSNQNIFPANDRTSALTSPQDPAVIKYNYLDAGSAGQWLRYKVNVDEAGFYKISFRYRQNSLVGMFTSRRIRINGDIPFSEASMLRFVYGTEWKFEQLNDGTTEFLFYLEKGENEIEIETVLGSMAEYVYTIKNSVLELTNVYLKMLMVIGTNPDPQRDYGFARLMPETLQSLANQAQIILNVRDELLELTGLNGDQIQALDTIGELLEDMAEDEYLIAEKFVTFKNYIISLTNWLYNQLGQPLKLDYIYIQGTEDKTPKAAANFFQASWFEIRAFIASFFMDYTTLGFTYDKELAGTYDRTITMWASGSRDDTLILRYLIDNNFTPQTGINVNIKLFSAGLTEAILAGIGPDIAGMGTNDTITWGLRTAVEPLNDFDGFDEVTSWFHEAAMVPVTLYGVTYGLPTSLSFSMMFYRVDVFAENGLEIPQTWDDLYALLPTLLNKHLEIGMPSGLSGTLIFLYQNGEELYADDGMKTNLDSNGALAAFESLTAFFTKYNCKTSWDTTRFRTGEIPIIIGDYNGTYNGLMGLSDIRGLWEMAPMLGTIDEDGNINRTTIASTSAMVIPRGASDPSATWEYLKWYLSADTVYAMALEQIAVSGPTVKYNTANLEVLRSLPWTDYELEALNVQLDNLAAIPEYPGNYIVGTYVGNAFLDVYNNNTEPAEAMLDRIVDINKEISRKRKEFGMEYYEITYDGSLEGLEGLLDD